MQDVTMGLDADKGVPDRAPDTLAVYWRSDRGVHMNWIAISDIASGVPRAEILAHAYDTLMTHEAEVRQTVMEAREQYPPDAVLRAANAEELLAISDEITAARARVTDVHRRWLDQHAMLVMLPSGMATEAVNKLLTSINSLMMSGAGV